jgi:hypothetical protein
MDVFPALSDDGTMVYTAKQFGNASVVTSRPDGGDRKVVFNVDGKGLDPMLVKRGWPGRSSPHGRPMASGSPSALASGFRKGRMARPR